MKPSMTNVLHAAGVLAGTNSPAGEEELRDFRPGCMRWRRRSKRLAAEVTGGATSAHRADRESRAADW